MTTRTSNRAVVYLRRSDSKQESSLETQLDWTIGEAQRRGLRLNASRETLRLMLRQGLRAYGDVYVDDAISGAELDRPGLTSLVSNVTKDEAISHVLVYKRDRLGRPSDVLQMMVIERSITDSGVTLVLSDGIVSPTRRGQTDLPHIAQMLFGYHASGEFLHQLADRIIRTQRGLAEQGFRTGGNAPYGFARYLVGPDGAVIEELPRGKRVRQAGCHVRILPKDKDKIATWLYILDLKCQGWGIKRIARHLNELGIPSPDAGRIRTDQGAPHIVGGFWCPNTVSNLCRNAAILGLQEFGRRAEGAHRRLGTNGPRQLADDDRTIDEKPRDIFNPTELRITAPIGFDPLFDQQKWREIQDQMDARSQSQGGIRRAKDSAKYPLASVVFDLTDGCGAVMYGITSGQRRIYQCSRYRRSAGAQCHHNAVDAEALLGLLLKTLVHQVERHGHRDRLQTLLEQRARAEQQAPTSAGLADGVRVRIAELQRQKAAAGRRMAIEEDNARYAELAAQFDAIHEELQAAERELQRFERAERVAAVRSPDEEVAAAMQLFDRIDRVAQDEAARAEIAPLMRDLGVRVGVTFGAAIKGEKREVRVLRGGVIAFGGAPLPVPIHGADNREPLMPANMTAMAEVPEEAAASCCGDATTADAASTEGDVEAAGRSADKNRQLEDTSLPMVNRGDRI